MVETCLTCSKLVCDNGVCHECLKKKHQQNKINNMKFKEEKKITITELENQIVSQKETIIKMTKEIKEMNDEVNRVKIRNVNQEQMIMNLKSITKIEVKLFEDTIAQFKKRDTVGNSIITDLTKHIEDVINKR